MRCYKLSEDLKEKKKKLLSIEYPIRERALVVDSSLDVLTLPHLYLSIFLNNFFVGVVLMKYDVARAS